MPVLWEATRTLVHPSVQHACLERASCLCSSLRCRRHHFSPLVSVCVTIHCYTLVSVCVTIHCCTLLSVCVTIYVRCYTLLSVCVTIYVCCHTRPVGQLSSTLRVDAACRHDMRCKAKYGKHWDRYCALVPYKIIPYVY